MEFNCNINNACTVVLTEEGARIWNASFDALPEMYRPAPVAAGDTLKSQLWTLMSVFGPSTHIGMLSPHFERNHIIIDDRL